MLIKLLGASRNREYYLRRISGYRKLIRPCASSGVPCRRVDIVAYVIRRHLIEIKPVFARKPVSVEAFAVSGERRRKIVLGIRASRYLVVGIVSADVVLRNCAFRIAGRSGIRICRGRIRIAV